MFSAASIQSEVTHVPPVSNIASLDTRFRMWLIAWCLVQPRGPAAVIESASAEIYRWREFQSRGCEIFLPRLVRQ
jgi:hypothetical protein